MRFSQRQTVGVGVALFALGVALELGQYTRAQWLVTGLLAGLTADAALDVLRGYLAMYRAWRGGARA